MGAKGSKAKEEEELEVELCSTSSCCARRIAVEIGDGERRSQGSSAYLEVTILSRFREEGGKPEGAGRSPTAAASSGVAAMVSAFREMTSGRSSSTYRAGAFPCACSLKKRVSDPAPRLTIWARRGEEGVLFFATRERNERTRPETAACRQK